MLPGSAMIRVGRSLDEYHWLEPSVTGISIEIGRGSRKEACASAASAAAVIQNETPLAKSFEPPLFSRVL